MEANTLQAKDLRIGNLVNVPKTNQNVPITVINMDVGVVVNRSLAILNFHDIKPIHLSEDWLLKLGFEKDDNGVDIFDQDYYEWYQKDFPVIGELCQSSDKKYLFNTERDDLKIYYLHQLQNLYFALTGEELTI